MTAYSIQIHKAFDFAAIAHSVVMNQYRKDPDIVIPYFSHLVGVAFILASQRFPEEVIIAGVLHDLIEDVIEKGHPEYEKMTKDAFGNHVYDLVDWVTQRKKDAHGVKIDWHIRGQAYINRLMEAPNDAKAISCADKIHNIESLVLALERGVPIWNNLKATPADQLKKFQSLHAALSKTWEHPILDELQARIELLKPKIPSESQAYI